MAAITLVHVAGGGLALLAGALAVALRKGSRAHGQAGSVFALAMVAMALPGGVLAVMSGKPFDVLSSAMSLYLVLSGWVAFQGLTTARIVWMLTGAACCLIGYLAVEGYALATGIRATDAPVGVGYVFAGLMLVAACGDVRYARGGYRRRQLMLRHLWRMNFGLFIQACPGGAKYGYLCFRLPFLTYYWSKRFGMSTDWKTCSANLLNQ